MRRRDYTHHIDGFFRLNSDFNTRDEIGVRRTFSGLMKLIFPDENIDKEDARMILEYAIEGRRRVKEQLKIMAGVEFMDVNLGYVDAENPADARIVFVAEQADETLIPEAPLQPGARIRDRAEHRGRVRRIQAGEQGGCGVVPLRERGRRIEPCCSRVH